MWFPVLSLAVGLVVGFTLFSFTHWHVPPEYAPYLSVAALAGVDTLFGGIRAGIEGRFQTDIFVTGFLLNTLFAAALAALGDRIGINLALVAVIAIGSRVFLNLSLIRRYYLNQWTLKRNRQSDEVGQVASVTVPLAQEQKIGGV
ncbi:MAG: small basic family protein [Chthonomonadaceae bacterium]|nr:small basic family protein [Chthonomonadaceae bacterium]